MVSSTLTVSSGLAPAQFQLVVLVNVVVVTLLVVTDHIIFSRGQ